MSSKNYEVPIGKLVMRGILVVFLSNVKYHLAFFAHFERLFLSRLIVWIELQIGLQLRILEEVKCEAICTIQAILLFEVYKEVKEGC